MMKLENAQESAAVSHAVYVQPTATRTSVLSVLQMPNLNFSEVSKKTLQCFPSLLEKKKKANWYIPTGRCCFDNNMSKSNVYY